MPAFRRQETLGPFHLESAGEQTSLIFCVPAPLGGHGRARGPCTVPPTDADLGVQVTLRKVLEGVGTGPCPSPDGGIPRTRHPGVAE